MILGPISLLDCLAFVCFLVPQLLLQVNPFALLKCIIRAVPVIVFQIPFQLIQERVFTRQHCQTPFVRHATLFQDSVIRCVRYAFAHIPASIGAVFFSKYVNLPFMRFRLLRQRFLKSPLYYEEVEYFGVKGIWITWDNSEPPDTVIYYCHGGGFAMGSSYFYLEFLMVWLSLLVSRAGYRNPAVFTLEYTLVPEERFPTQLQQAHRGYEFAISQLPDKDASRVCVAGDSAGATLILSLLMSSAVDDADANIRPGLATLISPWCVLISAKNQNTTSDYLNAESLHQYAMQYLGRKCSPANSFKRSKRVSDNIGGKAGLEDEIASPGLTKDLNLWTRASPRSGFRFFFGAEEVLAPETRDLIEVLKRADVRVESIERTDAIHAWPIVDLFLCSSNKDRLDGLGRIVDAIAEVIPTSLKP